MRREAILCLTVAFAMLVPSVLSAQCVSYAPQCAPQSYGQCGYQQQASFNYACLPVAIGAAASHQCASSGLWACRVEKLSVGFAAFLQCNGGLPTGGNLRAVRRQIRQGARGASVQQVFRMRSMRSARCY